MSNDAFAAPALGRFTGRTLWLLTRLLSEPLPTFDLLVNETLQPRPRASHRAAALELGCGDGPALLTLQRRFPEASMACLNSQRYAASCRKMARRGLCGRGAGSGNGSRAALIATGVLQGMSRSRLASLPRLPQVTYGEYQQGLPYPPRSFDLVFSQFALDTGKVFFPSKEWPPLATAVARLLRPGGVALLQVLAAVDASLCRSDPAAGGGTAKAIVTSWHGAQLPRNSAAKSIHVIASARALVSGGPDGGGKAHRGCLDVLAVCRWAEHGRDWVLSVLMHAPRGCDPSGEGRSALRSEGRAERLVQGNVSFTNDYAELSNGSRLLKLAYRKWQRESYAASYIQAIKRWMSVR